jgi:hypothetical protein
MRLTFVDSFKDDLLSATPSRRKPPRRVRLALALVALLGALAIPAWATGLFSRGFPEDHRSPQYYPNTLGHRYVLDHGRVPGGYRFRIIGFRMKELPPPRIAGVPRQKRQILTCVELQTSPSLGRGNINGNLGEDCTTRADLARANVYDMGLKALPGRRIHAALLPASGVIVRASWFSGEHVDIVPNRPPLARLRASGFTFPFAYVAIVPPPGDRFKGAEVLDANGHVIARLRSPTPLRPGERPRRAHSPFLDLRRYRGQRGP